MNATTRIVTIAILVCLASTLACGDDLTQGHEHEFSAEAPFSFEVTTGFRTRLRVEGVNGIVKVTGDDGATAVTVTGVRRVESESQSDADARLPQLEVEVDSTDTEVIVRTFQPTNTEGRSYEVDYEITVPRTFQVNVGEANGKVEISSITSDVAVQIANGWIVGGAIVGTTTMSLANGVIDAEVTLPPGGVIDMTAANGTIDLRIPKSTSAGFSATVGTGAITVLGLDIDNYSHTGNAASGTLGDGNGVIGIRVSVGDITLQGI